MDPEIDKWARRYVADDQGRASVAIRACRLGVHPGVALQLAEEALQEVWPRYLKRSPCDFDGYAHFRNSVTRAAIHRLIDLLRRRQPFGLEGDRAAGGGTDPRPEALRQTLDDWDPREDGELLRLHELEGWTLDRLEREWLPPDGRSRNARRIGLCRRIRRLRDEELPPRLRREHPELDWPEPDSTPPTATPAPAGGEHVAADVH